MEGLGDGLVGVHGVSVGGERRDLQMVFFEGRLHLVDLFGMGEKILGVAVRLAREAAAADLHRLHAEAGQILARLVEGLILQKNRKYAELHDKSSWKIMP